LLPFSQKRDFAHGQKVVLDIHISFWAVWAISLCRGFVKANCLEVSYLFATSAGSESRCRKKQKDPQVLGLCLMSTTQGIDKYGHFSQWQVLWLARELYLVPGVNECCTLSHCIPVLCIMRFLVCDMERLQLVTHSILQQI